MWSYFSAPALSRRPGCGLGDDLSLQWAQASTVCFSFFCKTKNEITVPWCFTLCPCTCAQAQNAHERKCIGVGALGLRSRLQWNRYIIRSELIMQKWGGIDASRSSLRAQISGKRRGQEMIDILLGHSKYRYSTTCKAVGWETSWTQQHISNIDLCHHLCWNSKAVNNEFWCPSANILPQSCSCCENGPKHIHTHTRPHTQSSSPFDLMFCSVFSARLQISLNVLYQSVSEWRPVATVRREGGWEYRLPAGLDSH